MAIMPDLGDGRPPVCASCGGPLGDRFELSWDGKGYCVGCEVPAKPEEAPSPVETLGEIAERKARNVLVGRGQQRLSG